MNGTATENSVRIRRYQPDDVDAIYDAVMESKVELSHWMSWCHDAYSRNDVIAWVESRPSAWETNQEWSFVVVNDEGKLLGACGIHRIDRRNGVGELGYCVRTSATRNGVATSATRQLCQWAFEENMDCIALKSSFLKKMLRVSEWRQRSVPFEKEFYASEFFCMADGTMASCGPY